MNLPSSYRVQFRSSDFVAMVLVALGAVVVGGWIFGTPMTVAVGAERVGMTLNSAISLILAGLALSFGLKPVRLTLAILLAIPSALTLLQHLLGVDLLIDRLFGTSWIRQLMPNTGRMAPQVAAAFLLSALTFAQLTQPRASRLNWLAAVATAAVFFIAIVSLFGPLLRLDIVYDWRHAARIAPHTAAGIFLLSIGLAQLTYRRSFDYNNDVTNDARRILTISTAAILAITIACAAMCFTVVVRHSHDVQRAALGRELHNQAELIAAELATQRYEAQRIVASQSLDEILTKEISSRGPSATLRQSLQRWADRRLPLSRGLAAFDLVDAKGQSLISWGAPLTRSMTTVALDSMTHVEIGGEARVRIEHSLPRYAQGEAFAMRIQFSLPRLTAALQPEPVGSDVERAICYQAPSNATRCLHLAGTLAAVLPSTRGGAELTSALKLAASGKAGVTLGNDTNGARFFTAYGPIAETPLVMTFARPLETLYAELRRQLNMLLFFMIGLVAVGAWVLRWQIVPLIAKVVAARSRANDSAMHLAAIMDTAGDGIITVNRIGTVLSANPAFRRLLDGGRDPVGENLTDLLPGLELCADEHGELSLASCASESAMEFQRQRADGQALHLQVEFAWLDETTRSTLVATVRDLTMLKRGEHELREIHARLQHSERLHRDQATRLATLFDSVEDAIVIINASGTIEAWNRGAQYLFGYAAEDIIGKDVRLLMPEPNASMPIEQFLRYGHSGDRLHPGGRVEIEARHGSGRIVPIEISLREMLIEGNRLFSAVMRDISVRREVERMKSEFVSTISHELRTPLTSIAGSLTLISGGAAGEVPPKIARLVGIARQNSERLIRLINDILDLEKAEAGKLEFQFSVRSLRAEVASVAEFNRGFAQSLGVAIDLEDGEDADVFIDSDRLTQVLTNLISNAAKFSPPGGTVRIRVQREDPGVRVTVSDNGPGIPAEFCARIFQKFAQADASDSRAKSGTGLGLSIAKTITEKLGGRIGFDTVPGKGTSFYVVLPMHGRTLEVKPAAELSNKAEEPEAERSESLPRILHIEDDHSLTAIVREAMSRNAAVTSARSLATARELLQSQRFDAIILDVGLPDGSGIELLSDRSTEGEGAPIVVTYTADEPTRALRSRVDAALVKSRHSVTQLLVTVLAQLEERASHENGERRLG